MGWRSTGAGATTPLTEGVTEGQPAQLVRAVLTGSDANGATFANVGISERDAINVEQVGPLTAFGEVLSTGLLPRVQIDAIYGLLTTDHETLTAAGGSATASGGVFLASTGTNVGAVGVVRSRRIIRYRAGQGTRGRFTAAFTPGVANSLQGAGLFTSADGLVFGYVGATFGVLRRIGGANAIHRLTITNGATGAENLTITLDGVPFVVASGGALSAAATAQRIADLGSTFTGWTTSVSPQANGATVTFGQTIAATTSGAFSFSSSGGATGTFATIQAGATVDSVTGFVPQTEWNVDRLDGSNGSLNPSGMLLDPTKLNVYEIVTPWLGAGTIRWRVMTPAGRWVTVHRTEYPGTALVPSQRNPTFRLGWYARSLGSTTNLTVRGASAAGFVEGEPRSARDPYSTSVLTFNAGTTENVALALRSRGEFASTVNHREILPASVVVGTETAARALRVRVVLNPTLVGTVSWSYVDQANSAVERLAPSGVTITGGREVATDVVASGNAGRIDLSRLDLRMEPGDVLVIAIATASSSATCQIAANWQET